MSYIEKERKESAWDIRHKTGRSISDLIEEGLDYIIAKYNKTPKTIEEALTRLSGFGKKNDIKIKEMKNVRERLNRDLRERIKRVEVAFKK